MSNMSALPALYHQMPTAELRKRAADCTDILIGGTQWHPDMIAAARARFLSIRKELQRRGIIMGTKP